MFIVYYITICYIMINKHKLTRRCRLRKKISKLAPKTIFANVLQMYDAYILSPLTTLFMPLTRSPVCYTTHQGASIAECTNDKISTNWFDGNADARYVIWFFRDPSNKCEWKYHDRYTTNGVANLKSKFRTTMLSLIGASAACTGGAVESTTTSQKFDNKLDTTTIKTISTGQPTTQAAKCPIVIDVRTQLEWDEGHASCAHRLEIQNDPSLVDKVSTLANGDLSYPVYVYCRSGNRSGKAQKVLQDKKWTRVVNAGGWASGQTNIQKLCDCTSGVSDFGAARDAMSGWMILSVCMLTLNQVFV